MHKAGVCAGLIVPEPILPWLESQYLTWRKTLTNEEMERGEPKGSLLRKDSRRSFFEHLAGVPWIVTIPTIVDLEFQRQVSVPDLSNLLRTDGLRRSTYIKDIPTRKRLERMAKQMGRLHPSQLYRLRAMADCIEYALRDALAWYHSPSWATCWSQIAIRVDQPSRESGHPEVRFMKSGLPYVLKTVAARRPLIPSLKIDGRDHPVATAYCKNGVLDTDRMLEDFRFVDSKDEIAIQVVDILAHSLYLAVNDLADSKGNREWYGYFMQRSLVDPKSDLGITVAADGASGPRQYDAGKYEVLRQILRDELKLRF